MKDHPHLPHFESEGRAFNHADFEDTWDVEFTAEEAAKFDALRIINAGLCELGTLAKTHDGLFFMLWRETHPELGSFDEYFGGGPRERFGAPCAARLVERLAEWHELRRRMPDSHHVDGITRKEACATSRGFGSPKNSTVTWICRCIDARQSSARNGARRSQDRRALSFSIIGPRRPARRWQWRPVNPR